jgi:hypothetical protein
MIVLNEQAEGYVPGELECFLCGATLSFPYVMWAGFTGSVSLHYWCTPDLFIRLSRDLAELKLKHGLRIQFGPGEKKI